SLLLRLTPLAGLSGKIFDESGEPVREARIYLLRPGGSTNSGGERIGQGAITDDQGSYEFPAIAAGTYAVAVTANPWYAVHPPSSRGADGQKPTTHVGPTLDVAYPTTFYDSATELAGATAIFLKGGERKQVDI